VLLTVKLFDLTVCNQSVGGNMENMKLPHVLLNSVF
jgi:hypothetical protein